MKDKINRDFKQLNQLLKYDFTENMLAVIVLIGSLIICSIEFMKFNLFFAVPYFLVFLYVYHKYFGEDMDDMHRLNFEDKLLTESKTKEKQEEIAINLADFLAEHKVEFVTFDNWELNEIKKFLQTKKLNNPRAFLISDIYRKNFPNLKKSNHLKPSDKRKAGDELEELRDRDPNDIINEINAQVDQMKTK